MTDLIVKVVPQDPDVVEGPEDLIIVMGSGQMTILQPSEDMVVVPKISDLAIGVQPHDPIVAVTDIGPQGPPGPSGAAGEQIVTSVATVALGGQRVVKSVTGGVDYASSDVATDGDKVLGITQHAAAEDEPIDVQTGGPMDEPTWAWITGGPIFLGTNGLLTQTPPTLGVLVRVAKAISPTRILINVEEPIILA